MHLHRGRWVSSQRVRETGLLEVGRILTEAFMAPHRGLQALGSKTLFPFRSQAPVYQRDPGYFGRLREPTLPHFAVGCNVCPVQCCSLLLDPQLTPKHFSPPAQEAALDHCAQALSPVWRQLFKPSNKQCRRWCLPFILIPLASTFPQVMLIKRSNIKNSYHEGIPQRKNKLATCICISQPLL